MEEEVPVETNGHSPKLNQVLAIEKGIKDRAHKVSTDLYQIAQKPGLFNGFLKRYRRINEDSETYPDQKQKVQHSAIDSLQALAKVKTELVNITLQKDAANTGARADILIDGRVLVTQAPATFILWLEKQVEDLRTFITALPTLDESEEWEQDPNTGQYRTREPISTHRTQKVAKPIVLYDATANHPAQTQLITQDVLVGYWDEVKFSAALPVPAKKVLLERVDKLYRAVKVAREAANDVIAPRKDVSALFGYVLGG